MARRWLNLLVMVWLTVLFGIGSVILTPRAAWAVPAPSVPITADGCQRFDQMKAAAISVNAAHGKGIEMASFVYTLASHRCRVNPEAASRVDLRPQNEWAQPRDNIGYCNLLPSSGYAEPNDWLGGRTEDRCVADWLEYLLYLQAHPGCVTQANDNLEQLEASNPRYHERLDLRQSCNDANFGADEVYKGETTRERETDNIGWLFLVGWAIVIGVIVMIVAGISVGWKYNHG